MPIGRFNEIAPWLSAINITTAYTTTYVQTSPLQGRQARVDMMIATSTSDADRYLAVQVVSGTATLMLGSVLIPAGAGYTTVPPVDVLAALIPSPNDGLVLGATDVLKAAASATLGAGLAISVAVVGGYV